MNFQTDPLLESARRMEEFVRLFTAHQREVYVYILALLAHRAGAEEVLQETNLVLWRKFEEFHSGTSFGAWACRIAYYEVLKYRQRRRRDVLCFSEVFVEEIAAEAVEQRDALQARSRALADCLAKLPERDRDLIRRRYSPDASTRSLATEVGRSMDAVRKAVRRIRQALSECVTRELAAEERT